MFPQVIKYIHKLANPKNSDKTDSSQLANDEREKRNSL